MGEGGRGIYLCTGDTPLYRCISLYRNGASVHEQMSQGHKPCKDREGTKPREIRLF